MRDTGRFGESMAFLAHDWFPEEGKMMKGVLRYGDYEFILRHDGYETLISHYDVKPPVYDVPPLDLFSELAPWTYRVERAVHFKLATQEMPSDADLVERAEGLRRRNAEPVGPEK